MKASCVKFASLFIALALSGISDAWAHTFALGLRAGDEGGVEVWFRTWHGCNTPLSEGYIRIKGINVDYPESIGEANLRSCASTSINNPPQFELTTDAGYYCEVNSAGQILAKGSGIHPTAQPSLGFDPLNPVTTSSGGFVKKRTDAYGAILCDTDIQVQADSSDKWHGSLFVGLEPGLYDVEYLECNDPRALAFPGISGNNCYNGTGPSQDFEIEYTLIATLPPVEVTPELAGKPPIEVLPGDEEIAITYFAPDDGTVIDHYEYNLDSAGWTVVSPPDELEPASAGTLAVRQGTGTPSSGGANFSRLTFPAHGLLSDTDTVTVYLSHFPSGAAETKWASLFSVGERIGFQQGNVFIDGKISDLRDRGSYSQFTLRETRKIAERSLVSGQPITVGRLLPYGEVPRTIKVQGLTNDSSYSIEFRAVGVDGDAGDASEDQTEIPRPNCEDVTAAGGGFPCQINGVVYEVSDLHIFNTTADAAAASVCGVGASYSGHKLPASAVTLCRQTSDDQTVRAIFDWDNSQADAVLDWLSTVSQVGSRSEGDVSCTTQTPSGRCVAQLANGYGAFRGMAGSGGSAIKSLNVSNLSDMRDMFRDTVVFDQDLSSWNVASVTYREGFDAGAEGWCGLGYTNRGRPGGWNPTEARGCLNVVLESPAVVVAGDQFEYEIQFYNSSPSDFTNGTLTLEVPSDITLLSAGGGGTISGQKVTWTGLTVPAGSSAEGGGGELGVTAQVSATATDAAELISSATLTDAAATSINDLASIRPTSKALLVATLSAPEYVVPGDVIEYVATVTNLGRFATQSGAVRLEWYGDDPFTFEGVQTGCAGNTCLWDDSDLGPGETETRRVQIRVGSNAGTGGQLDARLSASAPNNIETAQNNAAAYTDIEAVPALQVLLETLPTAIVGIDEEFKVLVEVANRGSAAAESTTVTLNLPAGASFVSALAGGTESGGQITWTLNNLAPLNGAIQLVASLRAPNSKSDMELIAEATTLAALSSGVRTLTASDAHTLVVDDAPVLDLQLTISPDPVAPGDDLFMRFDYQNVGYALAQGVTLTFKVPADTTLNLADSYPDNGVCSKSPCDGGASVSYDLGTVQGQTGGSVYLVLAVDANTTALSISGSGASIGSDGTDPLVPQAASAQVQVVSGPILVVRQSADREYVPRGGLVSYTIDFENRGISTATDVRLDNYPPTDTRVVAAPGATNVESDGLKSLRWSADILEANSPPGSVQTRLEVAGNATLGATLNNVVTLSDPNQLIYAEPINVKVVEDAVLETTISTIPSLAAPGKPYLYTVEYGNQGTADATNVTLSFVVPVSVAVDDCEGCTQVGNVLSWSFDALPAGKEGRKTVSVTVNAMVPQYTTLYAVSRISEPQAAPQLAGTVSQVIDDLLVAQRTAESFSDDRGAASGRSGPVAVASTLVARIPATDISANATTEVIRGGQIGVNVVVSNLGAATATGAAVETVIPVGTQLLYIGSQGSCSPDPASCGAGSTLSWTLGNLVPGSQQAISYALSVKEDAALRQRRQIVTLTTNEEDPQIAVATTSVVAGALRIDKSVTDANGATNAVYAAVGDTVTYNLTVTNDNPAASPDLVVTDALSPEVAACSASCLNLSGSGASLSGGVLTWQNVDLGPGEAITLSYDVTIPNVTNLTTLDNLANVRSTIGQTSSDNAPLIITSIADLDVAISAPAGLQPDESGAIKITYENKGSAATSASLRYLLPDDLAVTDAAGASISGSAYSWAINELAAGGSGGLTLTVKADAAALADEVLTHFVSLEGAAANIAAQATDTTVIGLVEDMAVSVDAPTPLVTGDTFTTTIAASNSGNAVANGNTVRLSLPTGFTVIDAAGGSVAGQVISWTFDLPVGGSKTLAPKIGTPAAADTGVLNVELVAASGLTETASTTVRVNALTSSVIQAAAQFSATGAMAGESVTLVAGPVNVGGLASGPVSNAVVVSEGLLATDYDGATWDATSRTLSWTTASLASRGIDPKAFTLVVEDTGALNAAITSNDATGQASMERTYPEEVGITPQNPESTCKLSGLPDVAAAPTPPAGITLALPNSVGFTLIDCDRDPDGGYPETLSITIDMGQVVDPASRLYKIADSGDWSQIEDAVISGQTVTYTITDDGDLDMDKTPGTLRDPVALATPREITPVVIPFWMLGLVAGLLGWLGYRRLSTT